MKNASSKGGANKALAIPLRITSTYLIVGGLWIFLSDRVLGLIVTNPRVITQIATIKGWFFVAATGLMLYALIVRGVSQIRHSEEQTRRTEMKYRELVENANSIIMRRDPTGRITFFNEFAQSFFGYQEDEILGRNVVGTIVPEVDGSGRNLKTMIEDIGKHPERYANNENENIRRNDERVWIAWTNKPIRDERGQITEILCVGNDITKRKQAEESLRRFELLVAYSRDIILFVRPDDGRILEANEAAVKAYGHSRDQLLTMTVHQLRSPETLESIPGQLVEANLHGILLETAHRRSDGSIFPVEISSRGENIGGIRILISVIRDITERKRAEEALRISEERFRKLFEESPIGIAFLGKQREITLTNQRYRDFLGYTEAEIIEKGPKGLLHPDDWERSMALSTKLRSGEIPLFHMEQRYIRKDGAVVWADTQIIVLRDENGELLHTIGWVQDITDRKRVEEEVRENERKYRVLFEAANDGIFLQDARGCFVDCNERGATMYGLPKEDILGRSPAELSPERQPDGRLSSEVAKERTLAVLDGKPQSFEWKHLRADGAASDVEITLNRVEMGDTYLVQAIVRDITDRKRTESALRESQARFLAAVESLPFEFWMMNSEGYYVMQNSACRKRFGDIVEKCPKDVSPDKDTLRIWEENNRLAFAGEFVEGEAKSLSAGAERRYRTILAPVRDGDEIRGILGVNIDITQQKLAEEERGRLAERLQRAEKMEALGTLAGGVAHDLNNVLGVVVGYSELLLHEVKDESSPINAYSKGILKGGERAAAIVQDLLTLARRGVPSRKVLNLNDIVVECQDSPEFAKVYSYHPDIKVKIELEADLLNISGSAVHLGKSLMNLVSNAAEAMPNGGTTTIKTGNQYLDKPISGYDEVREGDYVVLSVSDTGEGISAVDLKRIFEPFYTKKVMGRSGTGLGLAVVWGTVKDHHGYINVLSEEGKGAAFTLYFPVTREELVSEQVSMSVREYLGKGETILIVDDVREQRELATTMLKKLHYSVTSVSSGEETLEYLKQHQVDLVILDMIMDHGMDGLDTYARIIEAHPQQKAIIVSGFSETERVAKAQALGAGAYVKKPYVLETLGRAVRMELDR